MKKIATLSFALLMALVLAGPLAASDQETVTLEGNLLCAKCTLHEEGLENCQNVLVVMANGEETFYHLAKTETNSAYGDVCMKSRAVRVTGQVEEKDGRMWIAASEIVSVENAG